MDEGDKETSVHPLQPAQGPPGAGTKAEPKDSTSSPRSQSVTPVSFGIRYDLYQCHPQIGGMLPC